MKDIPEQREDDTLFARLFSEWGDQSKMALLMGVTTTTFRRMLNPDDEDHPSDLHRAKRLIFAAYEHDKAKAAAVWAELESVKLRAEGGETKGVARFPSKLAFDVIYRETHSTAEELERIPFARRRAFVLQLIEELRSYLNGLMEDDIEDDEGYRGGEGSERADQRETSTTRPQPVAASR